MPVIHHLLLIMCVGQAGGEVPKDFPPLPDFQTRVNYIAWYKQSRQVDDQDNAYVAYARFMPRLVGSTVQDSDWPEFAGMLTTKEDQKKDEYPKWPGPMPWDPRRRPVWEASYQRTRGVLKQYAAASKKRTLVALTDQTGEADSLDNVLVLILLPHLSNLNGSCSRDTREAAWRMKDGRVSGKRFIRSVHTNLRVAHQLKESVFMIEGLVSISVRAKTYRNIRWTLAHGVLAKKRIATLSKLLRKIDHDPIDMSSGLRGECAFLLDELQYVFGPLAGGGSKFNGKRYQELTRQNMGAANRFALGAQLERNPQAAAKAILDAHVAMIPHMQPGYRPEHHQALGDLYERMTSSSKVLKGLRLDSRGYAGIYQSAAQCEAERRATRLLVELFVYQAKKGKWPKTLDALPKRVPKLIKQDVFRDEPFVYILLEDGPVLYSVGPDGEDDGGEHDSRWGQGADFVFWPVPGSEEVLAASRLYRVPDAKLTAISVIGKVVKGKAVTVAAEVASISSRPSEEHGLRHAVGLSQDGATIELFYYELVAAGLTENQKIKPGMRIRAEAVVVEGSDQTWRLKLTDAKNVVIEPQG